MNNKPWSIKIIDKPEEMVAVENLQRLVWPGSEIDIAPAHVLLAGVHNGGLLIGAYIDDQLVGFVFGFPGLYYTPDGPRPKHYSHMLGVHPDHRNRGLGFALKRAQWQMVRHQGIDRITWTYDPLLSPNARLNITKLGAVCNTYLKEFYGEMRDGLNVGLPSDRFQVDWWVNTRRVFRRLSRRARRILDLPQYLAAGAQIVNPTQIDEQGWPRPAPYPDLQVEGIESSLQLVELPANFLSLKAADPGLGLEWRLHTRMIFETLFKKGYLVTDFVYHTDVPPRSFYILSFGESTL